MSTTSLLEPAERDETPLQAETTPASIEVRGASRRFGPRVALDSVDLSVAPGEIHALLGPNGAGKTTLLRILTGLLEADAGHVRLLGVDPLGDSKVLRRSIGFVPSGDRSFYLRISGRENLVFFARLHGMRYRTAVARADDVLEQVDLLDAARLRVGDYSHGMQKRLGVARALLASPPVLLLDEATHDLDPEASERVRAIVRDLAAEGASILWTTQRLEEIKGFAATVTLLRTGQVCFSGTVPQLLAHATHRRYLVRLRLNGRPVDLDDAVGSLGTMAPSTVQDADHYLLTLAEGAVLGRALAALSEAGAEVVGCSDARSGIEEAFLSLVRGDSGT